jgi:hypothetical protein
MRVTLDTGSITQVQFLIDNPVMLQALQVEARA